MMEDNNGIKYDLFGYSNNSDTVNLEPAKSFLEYWLLGLHFIKIQI